MPRERIAARRDCHTSPKLEPRWQFHPRSPRLRDGLVLLLALCEIGKMVVTRY